VARNENKLRLRVVFVQMVVGVFNTEDAENTEKRKGRTRGKHGEG
jgi:hypothetical protein